MLNNHHSQVRLGGSDGASFSLSCGGGVGVSKADGGGVGVLPAVPGEGEGVLPSALDGSVGDGVGVGAFAPESGVGVGMPTPPLV